MTNAVASSSKRPAPSTSSTTNKAKRPRTSTSSNESHQDQDQDDVDDEGDDAGVTYENADEELKAKIARKEARTIRNRESAQRSRNQRKAHLAYLEQRVVELEAENRTLKGDSNSTSPSTPSYSVGRETSPAQSVISLANDLGIPSELVNGTGVKLSNVAPPPRDMELEDIKPIINSTPSPIPEQHHVSYEINEVEKIKADNAALRERISLLENLVKQVVAVANFSGPSTANQDIKPTIIDNRSNEIISPINQNNVDWSSFISAPVSLPQTTGLEATLSPPLYPSTITDIPMPTTSQPLSENQILLNGIVSQSNPVARHPAEVATQSSSSSLLGEEEKKKALQRARGNHSKVSTISIQQNHLITQERINLVARLIIALAHQKGWINNNNNNIRSQTSTMEMDYGIMDKQKFLGKMESTH